MNSVLVFVGSRSKVISPLNLGLCFAVTFPATYFLAFHLLACLRLFREPVGFPCSFQFLTLRIYCYEQSWRDVIPCDLSFNECREVEFFLNTDKFCVMTFCSFVEDWVLLCCRIVYWGKELLAFWAKKRGRLTKGCFITRMSENLSIP